MSNHTATAPSPALLAALATARATVATLEAALAEVQRAEAGPADGRLLTLEGAADASGLSASTLRTWCKRGRLKSVRGPRGAYLVTTADVHQALAVEPVRPLKKTTATDDESTGDPLEQELRRGSLVARR